MIMSVTQTHWSGFQNQNENRKKSGDEFISDYVHISRKGKAVIRLYLVSYYGVQMM